MLRTFRYGLATAAVAGGTILLGATAQAQGTAPQRAPMRNAPMMAPSPHSDITTGSVRARRPHSDQIRGPVVNGATGQVRPGNPSPSVR
ncbi:MAG: hypothetical protein PGN34_13855 [Methylobacterium frigidaeris]